MNNSAEIEIREFLKEDFPAVKQIYQMGIDTGIATFETMAPNWETWDKKFRSDLRLVALDKSEISGWIALSAVSARPVYSGVCEVSLYVHPKHSGRGIGRALLKAIITESERKNIWTLQAGIFPENIASIKLHKAEGFREVGFREKIGKRDGVWRDNIFLERRSKIIGT
ncbi:MAG TPA: GNAT family N-acetyltransferase [Salegentibacter sp.]|nr:GNAT family N-acetyltransferase [Salegentibacter sp.]